MKRFKTFLMAMVIACALAFSTPGAIAKDWKECGTDLYIINPLQEKIIYNILWIDHDIEKYKGQPVPRCGGELKAGGDYKVGGDTGDFKLCPGRHVAIFHIVLGSTGGRTVKVQPYGFIVKDTDAALDLSPTGIPVKVGRKPEKKGDSI